MKITDFLLKYRKPLFSPEGGDGGAAPSGGDGAGADGAAPAVSSPADGAAPDASKTLLTDGAKPDGEGEAAKPDGEKPDGDAGEDKDGEGAADETAEFAIKAPEGLEDFQGDFDTFTSEASDWMKENPTATPADALKWAAERQAGLVSSQLSETQEAFTKQITTWESEARADPDIGGAKFDENLGEALKAIDTFGSDELKSVLTDTGLGSHPAMIKFAFKAAAALKGAPVIKSGPGGQKRSMAESLYPKK